MTEIDECRARPLTPPSDEINIWIAHHDRRMSPAALARCRDVLSDHEAEQERHFRSPGDRHAYLVTRATQREILSRYTGTDPRTLRFVKNEFGRPSLHDAHGCEDLDFNISHDGNVTILGLARGCRVGLDVAAVHNRQSFMNVARRFFCPAEVEALEALPVDRRNDRFLEYWTLKEAYIKARGGGLSISLNTFAFSLEEEGGVTFLEHGSQAQSQVSSWRFWTFRPKPEIIIALCAAQETTPVTRVLLHEIQPFDGEISLATLPCRIPSDRAASRP
ncbi:4'-phosphopantetheinyl transferase family protein [Agrobacterium rosae]|uniref:4'-phosphopantetheinyl transferase superfamily protein n=1 Tax=Agrobacterium rosae TaxID=1972867 RepID=A0AAW9FJG0_9HYPH|nr:4'-phosphopantetheinyl transferase superfamily protein [Agrobacterium rosae]MDX8305554.1 4'-phosphopantetheinyl transferase superfamily protein [Agrobacterium rosae]